MSIETIRKEGPTPQHRLYAEDEIDLMALCAGLWRRKWLIVSTAAGSMLVALAYLLLTSPVYESVAHLRPPLSSQLVSINETELLEVTPQDAFSRVVFEARSLSTQRAVFNQLIGELLEEQPANEEEAERHFLRTFAPALKVDISGLGKNDVLAETRMAIQFQHTNNIATAKVANALAREAENRALKGILDDLQTLLETRINILESRIEQSADILKLNDSDSIVRLREDDKLQRLELKDKIDALTRKAQQLRRDRIAELGEALTVAQRLSIEEPTTMQILSRPDSVGSVSVSAELSGEGEPLYLRGTRMLQAEIDTLKQRESDAHTVPELRDLEEQLALLEHNRRIEILQAREDYHALATNTDSLRAEISLLRGHLNASYDSVRMARVDQPAIVRTVPVKPRKALVLALAIVAGGMLGVLIALVMAAVENRRSPEPA